MISEKLQNQWINAARASVQKPPHIPLFNVQINAAFEGLDIADENFWQADSAQKIIGVLKASLVSCTLPAAKTAISALKTTYVSAQKHKGFEI